MLLQYFIKVVFILEEYTKFQDIYQKGIQNSSYTVTIQRAVVVYRQNWLNCTRSMKSLFHSFSFLFNSILAVFYRFFRRKKVLVSGSERKIFKIFVAFCDVKNFR